MLLIAACMTAGQGWAVERLVFRPLRATRTHVPLIAAIGASVFLQELVRLLQGARDRWLAPVLTDRFTLAGEGVFPVTVSAAQVLIVGAHPLPVRRALVAAQPHRFRPKQSRVQRRHADGGAAGS